MHTAEQGTKCCRVARQDRWQSNSTKINFLDMHVWPFLQYLSTDPQCTAALSALHAVKVFSSCFRASARLNRMMLRCAVGISHRRFIAS